MYLYLIIIVFIVIFLIIPVNIKKIVYIDRKTNQKIEEKVPGEIYLKWLYYNPFGKIFLNTLIKKKIISEIYGKQMDKSSSRKKIINFVNTYNINMEESIKKIEEFENFNDFFCRKLKKESRKISNKFIISPADGKIIAFNNLSEIESFFIKGEKFNIKKYLNDEEIYKEYENGAMAIIRLAPVDYHRFHFPVDGIAGNNKKIAGDYLSVSPIALKNKIDIFMKNKREYCIVENEKIGKMIMSEIGATMVGSIVQTYEENNNVKKGDEKGYFKFGGSSVMILFKENTVKFDKDIIENTKNGYETLVMMGEGIGDY